MVHDEWRERYKRRNDITSKITHLTNGNSADEAFKNLLSILVDKKIKGGFGYVNGKIPVVCLQEAPIYSIVENLMYENFLRKESGLKKVGIEDSV